MRKAERQQQISESMYAAIKVLRAAQDECRVRGDEENTMAFYRLGRNAVVCVEATLDEAEIEAMTQEAKRP